MVTTRQIMRGVGRTMRAIDRDIQRSQRRRDSYERAAQKQAMLEAAADAADEYESLIDQLVRAHCETPTVVDWRPIAARTPLPEPQLITVRADAARREQAAYMPGWFARTFGFATMHRRALAAAVEAGVSADQADFERRRREVTVANSESEFARRVVALDKEAIVEVLTKHSALGKLSFCLEEIEVWFGDDGRICARVDGLDLEDMPTQSVTLLQSGKASIKPLVRTRILELHRDNICSSALRIAVEFLGVLPIDTVDVEMSSDVLDAGTGHIEAKPVLRLTVASQAVAALNLARAEPAAVIERLAGEFDWSKRDGFRPLAP